MTGAVIASGRAPLIITGWVNDSGATRAATTCDPVQGFGTIRVEFSVHDVVGGPERIDVNVDGVSFDDITSGDLFAIQFNDTIEISFQLSGGSDSGICDVTVYDGQSSDIIDTFTLTVT